MQIKIPSKKTPLSPVPRKKDSVFSISVLSQFALCKLS